MNTVILTALQKFAQKIKTKDCCSLLPQCIIQTIYMIQYTCDVSLTVQE